jgi:tellurite resistance protein
MNARELAAAWTYRREWGFESIPSVTDLEAFGKALLTCANSDGGLSAEERKWVIGYLASSGAPLSLLSELSSYEGKGDIEAILSRSPAARAYRRLIVFDAIRACSSDGDFQPKERAGILRMAAILGLSERAVEEVEEAFHAEVKAHAARLAAVFPDGPPR